VPRPRECAGRARQAQIPDAHRLQELQAQRISLINRAAIRFCLGKRKRIEKDDESSTHHDRQVVNDPAADNHMQGFAPEGSRRSRCRSVSSGTR
jgi:hypothetical protein